MYHQSHMIAFNSQQQAFLNMTSSQKTSSESDMRRNIIDNSESTGNNTMEAPPSGDDHQDPRHQTKRCRYQRHTQHQIQEMERFFGDCPHPDDQQRKELSIMLGLEPMQIKFWFQNKRTQVKSQYERNENNILRVENEKLREDNENFKEALNNSTCVACGGPTNDIGEMSFDEQQLRIENLRLRNEVEKVSALAAEFGPNNMDDLPLDLGVGNNFAEQPVINIEMYGGGSDDDEPFDLTAEKPMIADLAVAAMEELTKLALSGEPMWIPGNYGSEILNQDEYLRTFPRRMFLNAMGLEIESSRQSAVIIMNPVKLVDILMDSDQWSKVFCGIVTRAMNSEVITAGVAGNYDGAMQVMSAEFQLPSPFVCTRDNYFVRYCKQQSEESWAIVDFPLDHLMVTPSGVMGSNRRPSGCIIQELPNGYSKVIWVEHAVVDYSGVHDLYKILVNSSLAFGAKRWVATLDRQCERLASSMATNIPAGDFRGVITTLGGRSSMLKLAERMIMSFYGGVGAAAIFPWSPLTSCEDVRIMSRMSIDDPGRPAGVVISASTSLWLSLPPKKVFDFLHDETSRNQWDILSKGGVVTEMAHIANGRDPGNCVSLLRVNGPNSAQSNMVILQESRTDVTGSYIVFAPIDFPAMNNVLTGADPEHVALLPSGFAILPDGPIMRHGEPIAGIGSGGCLVTVAFQILVDSGPNARLDDVSITTVNNLIRCTVDRIKDAIMRDRAP